MSSTGRGAQRHPDDFYETPAWAIRAALRLFPWPSYASPTLLEPMAGRGAVVREMRARWPKAEIIACELDPERASQLEAAGASYVHIGDFFELSKGWKPNDFDLALTNPAFSLAAEAIKTARTIATLTSMLLRLNYLGSQERAPFWRANPCDVDILPKRPSFAASLKCKEKGCGWAVTQLLEEPRAKACPVCSGKVVVTTTDSCEYAWFTWGPGRGQRWSILDLEEAV